MAVPLQQSSNASLKYFNAGQWRWEIDCSAAQDGSNWQELRALTSGTVAFSPKSVDDTDFGSNGWASAAIMGNSWKIDLKGAVKGTGVKPNRVINPALVRLLNAGMTLGDDNTIHLRGWRTDELPLSFEGYAACETNLDDGKPDGGQNWTGTLTGKGAPIPIAKQTAAGTIGAVLTLNTATSVTLGLNGKAVAVTPSTTASALQTAVQAVTGFSATTVTGSTGGPYTFANIPASATLSVLSNDGTATFA
ncbi:hypothetical protein GCM10027169_13150 [Gordonia jinhuaensis]|uniref:Major tail protein n=1 Tax=Gordonia jinhuaensis TaxID=1517702 RepID=A0A916SXH7_9ACTN|nr:hypothetical protein [Gordonia jinhuaensis]GGB22587.1 hypothetical protein GCM10011489_08490 [Gordonia jinhuaensis]